MIRLLKELLPYILKNSVLTSLLLVVMKLAGRKNFEERVKKLKAEQAFFENFNYPKTVLNGPFKGLEYPALVSNCSDMAPKIVGSYEKELHQIVERICLDNQYKTVLDVGCAEGYYAVGLLRRMPEIIMHAYDINSLGRKFCLDMARTNKVENRLKVNEFCSPETLANFDFKNKSLIICDCEGYEIKLFDATNIGNLKNCDILVELHDLFDPKISPTLLPLFKASHNLTLINAVYRDSVEFRSLSIFSKEVADLIVSESREGEQQWAFFQSKAYNYPA